VDAPRLLAVLPDQQIPYHDPVLHDRVLEWLEDQRPDSVVLSGDVIDLPGLSRHDPKAHELEDRVNRALKVTRGVLREYARASGAGDLHVIPGNHEQRFQKFVIKNSQQLFDIDDPHGASAYKLLSLPYLLDLEMMGYKWASDPVYMEDWPYGHVTITPYLAVYHGWLARKNSGATALATLDHLGHSVIVGHTHRQAEVFHTYHQIGGELRTLAGVEAGTLALARGGLGYAVAPNWQPGFATAWLWPDGMFDVGLAKFVNGALLWDGLRYDGRGRATG